MNPLKCAFGVSSEKFLGFIVHHKWINIDPTKAKVIQDMKPLKTVKELKSFKGRISYSRIFIPALFELIEPFHKLLKKNVPFQWRIQQQVAFQRVKDVLSSPQTMILSVKGVPITLDLTSTDRSIDTLLAQEVQRTERPLCYLSR